MKYRTATLSHDDIRCGIADQLYEMCSKTNSWPWIIDVYEGFALVKMRVGSEYGLHKIPYTINAEDCVELGSPSLIASKDPAQKATGTLALAATAVTTGDEAAAFLDELIEQNPLFCSLKGTPNAHFVVFDLTTIGKASKHAGKYKYRLAKSGLAAALPTLISKPIHVTAALDGHFDAYEDPKPIGAFLGGLAIDNEDGSTTLRVIGTLWESDFPAEVEEIQARKAELGASYEIMYPATAAAVNSAGVIDITEYQFAGGAILLKSAAAHPETALHVARRGAASTRRPVAASTTEPNSGRPAMLQSTKYAGVSIELEPVIDAAIAAALEKANGTVTVNDLKAQLATAGTEKQTAVTALETLRTEHTALEAKSTASATKVTELEAELTTVKAQLDAATKAAGEAQAKLDADALALKVTAKMAEIAKKHGLSAAQQAEAARLAIVQKIVANKEPVSIEEFESLIAGGTARPKAGTIPVPVPLMAGAGAGDTPPDPAVLAKTYPSIARQTYR